MGVVGFDLQSIEVNPVSLARHQPFKIDEGQQLGRWVTGFGDLRRYGLDWHGLDWHGLDWHGSH